MTSSELSQIGATLDSDGFAIVPRLLEDDELSFWAERFDEPVRAGRR